MSILGIPRFQNLLCLLLLSFIPPALGQGDLDPPGGAPGPTMKTLSQVEPRLPIDTSNDHVPLTEASYYLTRNIQQDAALVVDSAGSVVLDLNGFKIDNPSNGTILQLDDAVTLVVRNGFIRGSVALEPEAPARTILFENVTFKGRVATSEANMTAENLIFRNCRFEPAPFSSNASIFVRSPGINVHVSNCSFNTSFSWGIMVNSEADSLIVLDSTFSNATTSAIELRGFNTRVFVRNSHFLDNGSGILTRNGRAGLVVDNCVFQGGEHGINAGEYAKISNSRVFATTSHGLWVTDHARIDNCEVIDTDGTGIKAGDGAVITNSTLKFNLGSGIQAGSSCRVKDCTVYGNLAGGVSVAGYSTISGLDSSYNGRFFFETGNTTNSDADGLIAAENSMITSSAFNNNQGVGARLTGNEGFVREIQSLENEEGAMELGSNQWTVRDSLLSDNPKNLFGNQLLLSKGDVIPITPQGVDATHPGYNDD
jgi:hypothetical protein